MKREGFLFDRMISFSNLVAAAHKTFRGHRHTPAVARFSFHLETELLRLQEELRSGSYQPRPFRVFVIREPKPRQICAAHLRDRVVHHAVCNLLEPIFERGMIADSYACRAGKGSHAAIHRVQGLTRRFPWFLQCDIRKYFASLDHVVLKALLRRKIKDRQVLALLDGIIDFPIPGHPPGKGIPIGNLTSQHFANLYLDQLDHFVKETLSCKGYVRYMDDFLLFGTEKYGLFEAHQSIQDFLAERLRLELKSKAGVVASTTGGMAFLGFRIFPGLINPERRRWTRFQRRVGYLEQAFLNGGISETDLARSVASMIGHLQHAHTLVARRRFFARSLRLG